MKRITPGCCLSILIMGLVFPPVSAAAVPVDLAGYDSDCGIQVRHVDERLVVEWPLSNPQRARLTLDLRADKPLMESIEVSQNADQFGTIASSLDPVLMIRVGDRDLDKRGGWTIFFDRMQEKPHEVYFAELEKRQLSVSSHARRLVVRLHAVTVGPFQGDLEWTFYDGSPFVLQEAVLSTPRPATAYLYDSGLVFREVLPSTINWRTPVGEWKQVGVDFTGGATPVALRGRALCVSHDGRALALFPPPHRYFYPLDFSDNLANGWIGSDYENSGLPFGFGLRHDPRGDNRFVPWFNAPPGSKQRLGMFLQVSAGSAEQTLDEVARLTRNDRFVALPGHQVFSSHYHVEHTREVLEAQAEPPDPEAVTIEPDSGDTYRVPQRLQHPGFVQVFRNMGIDIVHLAEFHFGRTPRMPTAERLRHLEILHAECARLSDDTFLLLPGEEPNVHLGGHWISFFPEPVYWVLNRPDEKPFVQDHPTFGKVYHVGQAADVLQLLQLERGLAWTAHPRIKGSTGFPDRYRRELFFTSDRFLGAAWKAMPADLSQPRLGSRVLDLLDDMANWGDAKHVLGEVDVFKIEPDHELFAHMNVNYLRMEKAPRYKDGWGSILQTLRDGAFFVTTGEVLIPKFEVNGRQSGQTVAPSADGTATIELELQWTFPLSHAFIVSGNGQSTVHKRIDLSETQAFDQDRFRWEVDLRNQRWVRVEVWDIATNGAFTQTVKKKEEG